MKTFHGSVEPVSKPEFIMRLSGGDASHVISEGDSDGDGDGVSVGESKGLEDATFKADESDDSANGVDDRSVGENEDGGESTRLEDIMSGVVESDDIGNDVDTKSSSDSNGVAESMGVEDAIPDGFESDEICDDVDAELLTKIMEVDDDDTSVVVAGSDGEQPSTPAVPMGTSLKSSK
jgi:hypothetical protein